jgi:beta-glucosidase
LAKNSVVFDVWNKYSLVDWLAVRFLRQFWTFSFIEAMQTGVLSAYSPILPTKTLSSPTPNGPWKVPLDYIGLNYYTHFYCHLNFSGLLVKKSPIEIPTDMEYGIYPEGLYRSLSELAVLGLPIYITENGVADKEDKIRSLWIERHLFAVKKAMDDIPNLDVRGFYYWSIFDNFEWAFGYDMKFGLYAVDFQTQTRTLRKGSQAFLGAIKRSKVQP